jgi:hypothetical protein
MISRSRSAPTAFAMSMECTTSANRTVTCLYSADRVARATGAAHLLQNSESGGSCVPQEVHDSPAVVSPPPMGPRQYGVTADRRCLVISHTASDLDVRDAMARWLAGLASSAWTASGSGRGIGMEHDIRG